MIKTFFVVLVPMLALDALWLGVISKGLYQKYIGHLFAEKVDFASASVVYLLLALGISFFAVLPAEGSLGKAFLMGTLFGLIVYGVYDFTNMATLRDWPLTISLIDMAWGTVLGGVSALAGTYLLKIFSQIIHNS